MPVRITHGWLTNSSRERVSPWGEECAQRSQQGTDGEPGRRRRGERHDDQQAAARQHGADEAQQPGQRDEQRQRDAGGNSPEPQPGGVVLDLEQTGDHGQPIGDDHPEQEGEK
ncbi:hypothetical protein GCM10020001_044940 [Nonomuraea salmonea]